MPRQRADRAVGSQRSRARRAGAGGRRSSTSWCAGASRWLEGVDSGIDGRPDAASPTCRTRVRPSANLAERPGRCVGEEAWPSAADRAAARSLLGDGTLGGAITGAASTRSIGSVQTVGLDGGAWCADGRSDDLPLDQRGEDARSLTLRLAAARRAARARSASPRRGSSLAIAIARSRSSRVRLCEVLPDGASLLVTRGQLNLCHRSSHAEPEPLVPGEEVEVTVRWTRSAHRFAAGSRIRALGLPLLLAARLAVARARHAHARATAAAAALRAARALAARRRRRLRAARRAARSREPLRDETLLHGGSGGFRRIERDLAQRRSELIFDWDCGGRYALPERHRVRGHVRRDVLDRRGRSRCRRASGCENTCRARPRRLAGARSARSGTMTCTATHFLVTSELEVDEGATRVFARTWTHEFPRDYG